MMRIMLLVVLAGASISGFASELRPALPQKNSETKQSVGKGRQNNVVVGKAKKAEEGLLTYNGRFNLFGREGVATYTYKPLEDGTRSFHGKFKFTSSSGDMSVEGTFKDNLQYGTWKWNGSNILLSGNRPEKIVISFNADGYLDGPATFYAGERDQYRMQFRNGELIGGVPIISEWEDGLLKGTWEGGWLVGPYEYVSDTWHLKGTFNQNGYPKGRWISEEWDDNGRKTVEYMLYSDSGDLLESYRIDDSTGDKMRGGYDVCKVTFVPILYYYIEKFLMRDSCDLYRE